MSRTRGGEAPVKSALAGAAGKRVTPTTYTWVGVNGGIWDDPANWFGGTQEFPKPAWQISTSWHRRRAQTITLEPDDVNFQVSSLAVDERIVHAIGPRRAPTNRSPCPMESTLSAKWRQLELLHADFDGRRRGQQPLAGSFFGSATETGTGTVIINNQSNTYQFPWPEPICDQLGNGCSRQ